MGFNHNHRGGGGGEGCLSILLIDIETPWPNWLITNPTQLKQKKKKNPPQKKKSIKSKSVPSLKPLGWKGKGHARDGQVQVICVPNSHVMNTCIFGEMSTGEGSGGRGITEGLVVRENIAITGYTAGCG